MLSTSSLRWTTRCRHGPLSSSSVASVASVVSTFSVSAVSRRAWMSTKSSSSPSSTSQQPSSNNTAAASSSSSSTVTREIARQVWADVHTEAAKIADAAKRPSADELRKRFSQRVQQRFAELAKLKLAASSVSLDFDPNATVSRRPPSATSAPTTSTTSTRLAHRPVPDFFTLSDDALSRRLAGISDEQLLASSIDRLQERQRSEARRAADDTQPINWLDPEDVKRADQVEMAQLKRVVQNQVLELYELADRERLDAIEASRRAKTSLENDMSAVSTSSPSSSSSSSSSSTAASSSSTSRVANPLALTRDAKSARVNDGEAAYDHMRLRENVVDEWRAKYGERVGDDYEFATEEQLFDDPEPEAPAPAPFENLKPKLRPQRIDKMGRSYGTGYRKRSVAQVWIQRGTGVITVNNVNIASYFDRLVHRSAFLRPFAVTGTLGMFDVHVFVRGGGKTGQSGAAQLGVARALANFEPTLRPQLKQTLMLTRDTRIVERKKPGQPKARKQFAFVKR